MHDPTPGKALAGQGGRQVPPWEGAGGLGWDPAPGAAPIPASLLRRPCRRAARGHEIPGDVSPGLQCPFCCPGCPPAQVIVSCPPPPRSPPHRGYLKPHFWRAEHQQFQPTTISSSAKKRDNERDLLYGVRGDLLITGCVQEAGISNNDPEQRQKGFALFRGSPFVASVECFSPLSSTHSSRPASSRLPWLSAPPTPVLERRRAERGWKHQESVVSPGVINCPRCYRKKGPPILIGVCLA